MNRYHSVLVALLPLLTTACDDKPPSGDSGSKLETGVGCMDVEVDATCADAAEVKPDDLSSQSCGSDVVEVTGGGTYGLLHSGWDTGEGTPACCYDVQQTRSDCEYGRPLLIEGEPVLAQAERRTAWAAALVPADVPDVVRERLVARWTRAALDEHASVAAFSKVALDLMRFGAPAGLVALAHQAALDEVRHAELGFALVSGWRGEAVGPGPFPLERLDLSADLAAVARDAARESCLGETVAAMLAREGALRAEDPVLKKVLLAIADDEERHAQLGWRIVAWALDAGGPEVRAAVAAVFANAARAGVAVPLAQDEDLGRWGLLGRADAGRVADRCVTEIVLPAARLVLGGARTVEARAPLA